MGAYKGRQQGAPTRGTYKGHLQGAPTRGADKGCSRSPRQTSRAASAPRQPRQTTAKRGEGVVWGGERDLVGPQRAEAEAAGILTWPQLPWPV